MEQGLNVHPTEALTVLENVTKFKFMVFSITQIILHQELLWSNWETDC